MFKSEIRFVEFRIFMRKIGLTGGIGSGKSTVATIFKVLGIPVFDADAVAKQLMQSDPELKANLIDHFTDQVFKDGQLDRKFLASIVFHDAYQLNLLNSIVHPITLAAADRWFAQQNAPYVIKEAALMFESGASAGLDLVIGVSAPQAIRIKRVADRDGMSRSEVLARIDKQIDEGLKMRLCDEVILNDDQHSVLAQVLQLHERFCESPNIKKPLQ